MTVAISREPLRRMLRFTWGALLIGGVSLLAYCGMVLLDARMFQERENRLLDLLLDRDASTPVEIRVEPLSAPIPLAVTNGGLIGRMKIARLGLEAVIIEGSDRTVLRRAVGHVPGTPLPGQAGNAVIAGHRDTFFRPLRNVRRDDLIRLTTMRGEYVYRVVSTKIVDPDDVEVLDSNGGEVLTLITCYPFYFVGEAPRRFVVRADLMQ